MTTRSLKVLCLLTLVSAGCPTNTGTTDPGDAAVSSSDASVAPTDGGGVIADAGQDAPDAAQPGCTTTSECQPAGMEGRVCVDGQCVACDRGDRDCQCRLNGRCDADLRCAPDNTCVRCESGAEGCPCTAGGQCGAGLLCTGNVCVTDGCVSGELDCPCGTGGACAAGAEAYCDGMNVCRACTPEITGCACGAGGACGGDRVCMSGTCADCPATNRPAGCSCSSTLPCASNAVCDEGTCRQPLACEDACLPNQLCDTTLAGDPYCVPQACVDGYIWNGEACEALTPSSCDGRAGTVNLAPSCAAQGKECLETGGIARCLHTCDTLEATCIAEHRDCARGGATEDARCGVCSPGYGASGTACVALPRANCVLSAPDSIVAECDARLRSCDPTTGGGATCGACRAGSKLDDTRSRCIPEESCAGGLCVEGETCIYPQSGGQPRCMPRMCAANQAYDASGGSCVSCNLDCGGRPLWPDLVDGACACRDDVYCDYITDGASPRCHLSPCPPGEAATPGGECVQCPIVCGDTAGESPRLWPYTTLDGSCVCETLPGYYVPLGGAAVPLQCDADEDGWLNRTAGSTAPVNDPATQANFRCELRRVDRFVLRNELGQQRYVILCADSTLRMVVPGDEFPCEPVILALKEPDTLDSDDLLRGDDVQFPTYGARKLAAAELNPLTRACVSLTGDFNFNGREDVRDEQPMLKGRLPGLMFSGAEDFAFQSMSFFTELHRAFYEPSPSSEGLPGRYIIQERSRCDADFPVGYLSGGEYWRGCTRKRRGDYDFNSGTLLGQDFGMFSCAAETGTCPDLGPPVSAMPGDANNDGIIDHGACDGLGPPGDGIWRGMNHSSQFQCVVMRNAPSNPWELARDQLFQAPVADLPPRYEFNTCGAKACDGSDPSCEDGTAPGLLQPKSPVIQCTPTRRDDTTDEEVGFVATRFVSEGGTSTVRPSYVRGCISETYNATNPEGWKDLCGGVVNGSNPSQVLFAENQGDFGALVCGCGRYTGGHACDVACAERAVPNGSPMAPSTALHVGGADRGYDAETLAAYACSPTDGYCLLHPAVPSEGFLGGGRGVWLCGEFSSTRTEQSSGDQVLGGSGMVGGTMRRVAVTGGVRHQPMGRIALTQAGCDPAIESCWEAW